MDIIDIKKDITEDEKDTDSSSLQAWYGIKLERFYTIQVKAAETKDEMRVYTSYGKIGGKTTLNKKTFPNLEKATKFYHKTILTKERDQFRSVSLEDLQERQKRTKKTTTSSNSSKVKQPVQKDQPGDEKLQDRDLFNWGELQEEQYQYSEWTF